MVQKVLHPILGLRKHLPENLGQRGDGREVVLLEGGDFPEGGVERVGFERRGVGGVVGVCYGHVSTGEGSVSFLSLGG